MRAVLISYGYSRPTRQESHGEKGAGIMNDIDAKNESVCHNEAVRADHHNEATELGAPSIATRWVGYLAKRDRLSALVVEKYR